MTCYKFQEWSRTRSARRHAVLSKAPHRHAIHHQASVASRIARSRCRQVSDEAAIGPATLENAIRKLKPLEIDDAEPQTPAPGLLHDPAHRGAQRQELQARLLPGQGPGAVVRGLQHVELPGAVPAALVLHEGPGRGAQQLQRRALRRAARARHGRQGRQAPRAAGGSSLGPAPAQHLLILTRLATCAWQSRTLNSSLSSELEVPKGP